MKTMPLKQYFEKIGYDWTKDDAEIDGICRLTKTRAKPIGERSRYGTEQQFLIKAIAEQIQATSFFEIGTGRGTSCYVLSRLPYVERILTVDILPFNQKRHTAINYEKTFASNQDIYELIPYAEKEKIEFVTSDSKDWRSDQYRDQFDLAFIDGNHDDPQIIMQDFRTSEFVTRPDGWIMFDDYNCPWGTGVTEVVHAVLKTGSWIGELIEFRGHLFEDVSSNGSPEKDQGLIILKRK
jgi:predicted O-methyltransferase YrrM